MQKLPTSIVHRIIGRLKREAIIHFYHLCCFLPLQNKVIARSFEGRQFGDNPRGIMDNLQGQSLDLVWITRNGNQNSIPEGSRWVACEDTFRMLYEYATAKVWIDTHHIPLSVRKKRKGQILVETWHGGLGIKNLELAVPIFQNTRWMQNIVNHTNRMADVFITNSDHLTKAYRSAFRYEGKVWKIGYPKNDMILCGSAQAAHNRVCEAFSIDHDTKIAIYAPTYRDGHRADAIYLNEIYTLDGRRVLETLGKRFGGNWKLFIRLHPVLETEQLNIFADQDNDRINATHYPDMQELIMSADAFISDYSSCIFDAALRDIPCFTYATDLEAYKSTRGVCFEMEELPFPYATNNDELAKNICDFSQDDYLKKWEAFKTRTGLCETGHAGKDIAYIITEFIKGNRKPLDEIESEP